MGEAHRFPLRVVDGLRLEKGQRDALRPGAVLIDAAGVPRQLPRFFYEIASWRDATPRWRAPTCLVRGRVPSAPSRAPQTTICTWILDSCCRFRTKRRRTRSAWGAAPTRWKTSHERARVDVSAPEAAQARARRTWR